MEVTREIELESAPDEVWRAITESDWLGERATIEPRPGGEVSVGPRAGRDGEESSRVQFDLEEAPGGTRLVVTETRPLAALELEIPRGPVMLAHA